jgi:hypothetical protein
MLENPGSRGRAPSQLAVDWSGATQPPDASGSPDIFRLLFKHRQRMMGSSAKEHHLRAAIRWRRVVETWLRRQRLVSVRLN